MNTDRLVEQGVARIKATGTAPATVAAEILGDDWPSLPEDVRQGLACVGLARLLCDGLAADRARCTAEEYERKWQEEEGRRREAIRQSRETKEHNRQAYYRKHSRADFKRDVVAIHERMGPKPGSQFCADHHGGRVPSLLNCIGGVDVVYLPEAEREEYVRAEAERRRGRIEYEQLIERIHEESLCPFHQTAIFSEREQCVIRWTCEGRDPRTIPPEELQALIEKESFSRREARARQEEVVSSFQDWVYKQAVRDLESIVLAASDGAMRPLLAFTREDARQWNRKAATLAASWEARRDFFARMDAALEEAGADTVADLPPQALRDLGERAREVWKDSPRSPGLPAEAEPVPA